MEYRMVFCRVHPTWLLHLILFPVFPNHFKYSFTFTLLLKHRWSNPVFLPPCRVCWRLTRIVYILVSYAHPQSAVRLRWRLLTRGCSGKAILGYLLTAELDPSPTSIEDTTEVEACIGDRVLPIALLVWLSLLSNLGLEDDAESSYFLLVLVMDCLDGAFLFQIKDL